MEQRQFIYSILHLADLHRSPGDPISNDELLSSLHIDRLRYASEDPPIRPPDAIVVSGDIIQGVPLGTLDHRQQLRAQYSVADDFLARLCEEFVGGDRARVIFVPGNHDIDWNTSRAAMSEVASDREPPPEVAFREDSSYRWDWKSRHFFQVTDPHRYSQRLDAFWEFAESFYAAVPGLLRFTSGSDYNLFHLCDGRIAVAAFNSCHGSDCFARHGSIKREAIASSHLELISTHYPFGLLLAVWHHSIEGTPYQTDYMNIDLVRNMIGRGFRLGLYGHHHRSQVEPRHIFLPYRNSMAVVSAGSLCAGPRELPTGVHRQYNIVEIASTFESARVHVRQMDTAQLFSRAHLSILGGRSYLDIEWDTPQEIATRIGRAGATRHASTVVRAERCVRSHEFREALFLLEPLILELEEYGRTILFEAAVGAQRWDLVISAANPPNTILELTTLVEAYDRTEQVDLGRQALARYAPSLRMPDPMRNELLKRLAVREAQKK